MPSKAIQGRSSQRIEAPPDRCAHAAADAERWPEWLSTVRSVTSTGEGWLVQASLLGIPLVLAATVSADATRVTIRREPFGPDDEERFELTLTLGPEGGGRACRASAEISAEVDVPRLLPVPSAIADQVASRLLGDLEKRVTG